MDSYMYNIEGLGSILIRVPKPTTIGRPLSLL